MENNESLEQYLDKADKNAVTKQTKSPVKGIAILMFGVCAFAINYFFSFDSRGVISPLLIMISFSLTIWGIFAVTFRKKYYVNTSNKQKFEMKEVLFDSKEKDKLVRILSTNNYEELATLNGSNHDGLKLKYYATLDENTCFVQVISYINYEFVRITEVKQLRNEDAKNFIKIAKQKLK